MTRETTAAQQAQLDRVKTRRQGRGKLELDATPAHHHHAGLCAWLTKSLALDPAHPITGGARHGRPGPDAHVILTRADAPPLEFEPASKINTPGRLIETLSWFTLPTDGAVPAIEARHCRAISHVIRMLCGQRDAVTSEQETLGIIGTFLSAAQRVGVEPLPDEATGEPIERNVLTTYGTSGQRYEAAHCLSRMVDPETNRPDGPPSYFEDAETGELVIAVSDLQAAARRHVGSSLRHGWLDGRISSIGWRRITVQGYGLPGRTGRKQGPHARIDAYRGEMPTAAPTQGRPGEATGHEADEAGFHAQVREPVNT